MRTIIPFVTTLALAACDTNAPEPSQPIQAAQSEGAPLDTDLTRGYDRADHVEVAPGAFLRADLAATGRYRVLSGDPAEARRGGGRLECSIGETGDSGDEIPDSSLFDRWVGWYSAASTYSYTFDGETNHTITTTAWTSSGLLDPVDGVGAVQYVFLNDDYVGFVEDHQSDTVDVYTGLYLEVPCDDGFLDLTTLSTMYLRNGDNSLQVTSRSDSYAVCCPG